MVTVMTVFENGVLKPCEPLKLADGQTVQLTVSEPSAVTTLCAPAPDEDEFARRVNAATSVREMFAVMDTLPAGADGYDLFQALNENRKTTGERLLGPELPAGVNL